MKRQCDESENQIIRTLISDILPDQVFSNESYSVLIPAIIGFVLGLTIGTIIAILVGIANDLMIRIILIVCIVITEIICIEMGHYSHNKRSGKKKKKKYCKYR